MLGTYWHKQMNSPQTTRSNGELVASFDWNIWCMQCLDMRGQFVHHSFSPQYLPVDHNVAINLHSHSNQALSYHIQSSHSSSQPDFPGLFYIYNRGLYRIYKFNTEILQLSTTNINQRTLKLNLTMVDLIRDLLLIISIVTIKIGLLFEYN